MGSDFETDALREMGNIAAGQAVSVLHERSGEHVNIENTGIVQLQQYADVAEQLSGISPNETHVDVYTPIETVEGAVILDLSENNGIRLVDLVSGDVSPQFTERDQTVLKDVGADIADRYATAISDFLGIDLVCGTSRVAFKSPTAILHVVSQRAFQSVHGEANALLIHTPFNISNLVDGRLMFLLTIHDVDTFTKKLTEMV